MGVRARATVATVAVLLSGGVPAAQAKAKAKTPTVSFYRVHAETGSVSVTFTSDPATCAVVGRCGINGSEVYTLGGSGSGSFGEIAREGKLIEGDLLLTDGSVSTAVSVPGGGPQCTDQLPGVPLPLLLPATRSSSIAVDFALAGPASGDSASVADDIFDTHCPAPRITDLEPPNALPLTGVDPLSAGSVKVSQLLRRKATLNLAATHPIMASGFTGTATVAIQVKLIRLSLSAGQLKALTGGRAAH
ncbi:MAG TPA: hypothetical protein VHW26_05375 [Solirubrobacteraceae bacterium]|nr:hypothetical protein [Solirubrobacteraceae bacterium]